MGGFYSYFFPKLETPVKFFDRIVNIAKNNFRGILGFFVIVVTLAVLGDHNQVSTTVRMMWLWMGLFFLIQPVSVPVTGLIPIFLLPITGALSSDKTCLCYFNEHIALFILGGMLLLLMNNSEVDKRIALSILSFGDAGKFSKANLVIKASTAAFLLSMICNRLLVTSFLIEILTPIFTNLQSATAGYRSSEANYDEGRVLCIAVDCYGLLMVMMIYLRNLPYFRGSLVIVHSSYVVMTFRAIWNEHADYSDVFNYLDFMLFAGPLSFGLFLLNMGLNVIFVTALSGQKMTEARRTEIRTSLKKHKSAIKKKISLHEYLTVFFTVCALVLLFSRHSTHFSGWAPKGVSDTTPVALMVVALFCLPSGFKFFKIFSAKVQSELPPIKPESAILWWRFVDKNTNYGYIFVLGCGLALDKAIMESKLADQLKPFDMDWKVFVLLVCLVSVVMANAMTSVAVIVILMPYIMNLGAITVLAPIVSPEATSAAPSDVAKEPPAPETVLRDNTVPGAVTDSKYDTQLYIPALAVALGAAFGFCSPFLYTPAYFCRAGKTLKSHLKMMKYSVASSLLCMLGLWAGLVFYAPVLWGSVTGVAKDA